MSVDRIEAEELLGRKIGGTIPHLEVCTLAFDSELEHFDEAVAWLEYCDERTTKGK